MGVKYKREPHPSGLPVDPDGYVLIHADDMTQAIELMRERYGNNYAFVYPERMLKKRYHPAGVFDTIGEPT